jgi:hypothetical protein
MSESFPRDQISTLKESPHHSYQVYRYALTLTHLHATRTQPNMHILTNIKNEGDFPT